MIQIFQYYYYSLYRFSKKHAMVFADSFPLRAPCVRKLLLITNQYPKLQEHGH